MSVHIFQTPDGGEINVENGEPEQSSGLDSAVYLSLFGGNKEDDGAPNGRQQWWGNDGEPPEQQYRARLQHFLRRLPPVPANLRRLESAAREDLEWLTQVGAASSVDVSASMPALNTVAIDVTIDGSEAVRYTENWRAAQ